MLYGRSLFSFPVKEPAIARISEARGGQPEILWLQSMGIMDPYLSFNPELSWGEHQPVGLCNLTLTNPSGELIWETGKSYSGEGSYFSHFSDGMMAIDSIDQNAPRILVCGTKDKKGVLRIFDLNSGALDKEVNLPRNDYVWVMSGRSDPDRGGQTIVLTTQDMGYYRGGHGKHSALFLDSKGSAVKEVEVCGDGHFPTCFDPDGDGLDKFLLGYDLFDHDGTHLWRAEHWKDRPIRPMAQHSDQVHIYKANDGDSWSAIIAGSDALYRIDHKGRTIWRKSWFKRGKRFRYLPWPVPLHVQFLCVGKFVPNDSNDYIFVLHCREKMSLLNMDGKVVWRGRLPENWPGGKPACVNTDEFHIGTPMVLWKNPLGDGQDLIVYNEGGWPYAINGFGERVVEFPWPSEAKQPDTFILSGVSDPVSKPPSRANDWGYGYNCLVHDINGDGREEVLVYDRHFCWAYTVDHKL